MKGSSEPAADHPNPHFSSLAAPGVSAREVSEMLVTNRSRVDAANAVGGSRLENVTSSDFFGCIRFSTNVGHIYFLV